MRSFPSLAGKTVLVVDDDFYIAQDTSALIQLAGGEVLGPCPTEEAAFDAMAGSRLSVALLDVNLGGDRCFNLARTLINDGIPIVFVTGYGSNSIPAEFLKVTLLQKPVEAQAILAALATASAIQE